MINATDTMLGSRTNIEEEDKKEDEDEVIENPYAGGRDHLKIPPKKIEIKKIP